MPEVPTRLHAVLRIEYYLIRDPVLDPVLNAI